MVTLPMSQLEEIERSLKKALSTVRDLKTTKKTKVEKPPKFWTEKQWEEAEKEADKDIAAGRVYPLNNVEDLDKPLSELIK